MSSEPSLHFSVEQDCVVIQIGDALGVQRVQLVQALVDLDESQLVCEVELIRPRRCANNQGYSPVIPGQIVLSPRQEMRYDEVADAMYIELKREAVWAASRGVRAWILLDSDRFAGAVVRLDEPLIARMRQEYPFDE